MNNLFFERDGQVFMKVTPVKSLFNSSMIHDVVTKGGQFVVNMKTGELTIHRERYNREYKFYYYRGNGTARKLSNDLEVARIQLADEFTNKFTAGTFVILEKVLIPNSGEILDKDPITIIAKKNWNNFLKQVEKAYKSIRR